MNLRRRRKRLSRATIFGVIILTITLCGVFGYRQSILRGQGREYSSQLKELKKQKEKLAQDQKNLESFREHVKTDEYVEEVAREKFGLVYEDEIIFEPEEK